MACSAKREGGKTQCFVAYHKNAPVGFVSIALGPIGAKGGKGGELEQDQTVAKNATVKKEENKTVSLIGGNLFGRVFFLDCPNYGVQFR